MSVSLLDYSQMTNMLASRLKAGWVFIQCSNAEFYCILEKNVYLSPFGNNADYEIITAKCKMPDGHFGTAFIHICKKTIRLKEWLDEKCGESSPFGTWDNLAVLIFTEEQPNMYRIKALTLDSKVDYKKATQEYLKSFGVQKDGDGRRSLT